MIKNFEEFVNEAYLTTSTDWGTDGYGLDITVGMFNSKGKYIKFDEKEFKALIHDGKDSMYDRHVAEKIFDKYPDVEEISFTKYLNYADDEEYIGSWIKSELDKGFQEN